MTKYYADVKAKPDFVALEKEVLKFWEEDKTFEKSVHNRDGAAEFVFYDGPPFANGTPHYGHIMVSYVKDVVARFQTMDGKKVERRLGWDCHGLPAEMAADIRDEGILISGGGAMLDGLDKRLEKETGLDVRMSAHPEDDAAIGLGAAAADDRLLSTLIRAGAAESTGE